MSLCDGNIQRQGHSHSHGRIRDSRIHPSIPSLHRLSTRTTIVYAWRGCLVDTFNIFFIYTMRKWVFRVIFQAFIIFCAQLLYVPVMTLRTIMMVKGMKESAAAIGVLEGSIYVVALLIVFSDLSNYYNMVAYALGFGIGLYLGQMIEQKLAIGYVTVEVNTMTKNEALIARLREVGFSVSTSEVEGMHAAKRYRLDCTARRDREKEFIQIVSFYEPSAFVVSYEPRSFKGGYITKVMKKRREKYQKMKEQERSE